MHNMPQPTTDSGKRSTFAYAITSSSDTIREVVLIQRCKAGDTAAWDTLIRRYENLIYKFAYSLSHNQEDASDVTGQVFLSLYRNLHTFRDETSFMPWLFRIVRNTYLDMCVRPLHRGHLSLDASQTNDGEPFAKFEIMDTAPLPETVCLENETAQMLAKAIHHLPASQRLMLQMYHTEGKTYEEIAATTGISIGTVKSRMNRARTMLRERLTPFQEILTTRNAPIGLHLNGLHLAKRQDFKYMAQDEL